MKYLFLFTLVLSLQVQAQPFLYLNDDKISELQEAIKIPDSHHALAFQSLKNRVDANNLAVYGNDGNRYERSYLAQEAAFVSLMSKRLANKRKYAHKAYLTIKEIYQNPNQERLPPSGYGLSRAMMQLGLALPYTWCRQHWNDEEKEYVQTKINEALDAWISYDHANFGSERGSNWVAVCRGGELILMLAGNQQEKRKDRYDFLINQLLLHMQNGYGDLGMSQEGMGYIEYGVTFLLKAVYAAASIGDSTLYHEAEKHQWWQLAMYTESFQPFSRKFLMTGVAGSSAYNEGFASLLLNLTPTAQLPYFTWWYDHHMGTSASYLPADKFDNHRAGTIWAVIYYPVKHSSIDPTGIYPAAIADDHGYYFFRNRWQDENDIMLSLMADSHHHSHAWDQPEVFALNLMGYNTRFFGGPGKKRKDEFYSTLLVNGKYNIDESVKLAGKTELWLPGDQEGKLIVNGGQLYQALGVNWAQRHLQVKFLPDNQLLMVILDTVRSEKNNEYTWQANLGSNENKDSLQILSSNVDSKSIKINLAGRNQATLSCWFFADPIEADHLGDPLKVSTQGASESMLSICWLSDANIPEADIIRKNQLIKVTIKGQQITYKKSKNRIIIEDVIKTKE